MKRGLITGYHAAWSGHVTDIYCYHETFISAMTVNLDTRRAMTAEGTWAEVQVAFRKGVIDVKNKKEQIDIYLDITSHELFNATAP